MKIAGIARDRRHRRNLVVINAITAISAIPWGELETLYKTKT